MLIKPITYKTFNDEEVTEDFYFHLSKPDLVELMVSEKGGLEEYVKRLSKSGDNKEIVRILKDVIVKSIGERSENGKQFVKNSEITEQFIQSNAYDVLFMEFFTDPDAGALFISAVVPADLSEEVARTMAERNSEDVELPQPEQNEGDRLLALDRDLSSQEMSKLTQDQKLKAYEAKERRRNA